MVIADCKAVIAEGFAIDCEGSSSALSRSTGQQGRQTHELSQYLAFPGFGLVDSINMCLCLDMLMTLSMPAQDMSTDVLRSRLQLESVQVYVQGKMENRSAHETPRKLRLASRNLKAGAAKTHVACWLKQGSAGIGGKFRTYIWAVSHGC